MIRPPVDKTTAREVMKTFSCGVIAFLVSCHCRGAEYRFNPSMVGDGGNVDVSLFERGGQLPGTYPVDILLNGSRVDSRNVTFSQGEDANGAPVLVPCLSQETLSHYGVRGEDFLPPSGEEGESDRCFALSDIPGARADFLFSDQVLQLSIPQVYVRPELKGIAPQTLWDDGIPALLMNYQASVTRTSYRNAGGHDNSNAWVQLSPGANLGAWRIRNVTNWQQQGEHGGQWQAVSTRAERGLYDWKSRLTLGEHYTPSDIFDSVPFRGAMLGSDDSMVPGSQYAFAPVVRGVARTQARVEVRQNGYTLYDGVVAPGPFALTDLTPPGSGGDLEVTVWETDGQAQVFTVPWQTPAIALKEGYLRYNITGGQYRSANGATEKSPFFQTTAMYGLPWGLTAYGGLQTAENYRALTAGMGISLGNWGALSLDMTGGSGRRQNRKAEKGHALKLRYSKQFMSTRTTVIASE